MFKNYFFSLFLSVVIHGALLVGATTFIVHQKQVFSKKDGQAAIAIKLSVYEEPKKVQPPKPIADTGKKKVVEKKVTQPTQSSKTQVRETKGSDKLLAQYLSKVRDAITKNKIKSRMAKKLRLKGDVGLYFLIKRPNLIEGARVTKPSPYPQLNQSALATVESAKGIPAMPAELEIAQIPITVVISYQ